MPKEYTIPAHSSLMIDLEIKCEPQFKSGYYLLPRSSIYKYSVNMINSIGLIDYQYRGSLKVNVFNYSDK